jgi:putative DNA methylase
MPAKKMSTKENLADNIGKILGAGVEWHMETVDFSDPNRPKTCLEVDFPIVPINEVAAIEGSSGATRKPIYQVTKWWARRNSSVFRAMLLSAASKAPEDESDAAALVWNSYYGNHHENENFRKLKVAEPFMGGGTTIVEGSRLGMQLFGCDLNPVAWFVVRNEVTPVETNEVKHLVSEIEAEVKAYIMPYFTCDGPNGEKGIWYQKDETNSSGWKKMPEDFDIFSVPWNNRPLFRYDGPEIIYTFWAKHGPCAAQTCNHRTPLLSTPIVANKALTVKYWSDYHCIKCNESFDVEQFQARMAPDSPLVVGGGEKSFAAMNGRGEFNCPHCDHPHTDISGRIKGDSVSLGGKSKNKKVELSLLVHPSWMKGCGPADSEGTLFGGSPGDPPQATAAWLRERARNLKLLEIRGEVPEEVTCPISGITFPTGKDGGNIPKRSTFDCKEDTCGRQQDVLESIKKTKKTGPQAPYLIQGFSKARNESGYPYSGRFFAAATDSRRYVEAEMEWSERASNDLEKYWPKSEVPFGFMTHMNNGGIPNHGFTHWWKMFNPLQLLIHTQFLKALNQRRGQPLKNLEFVMAIFQQYLRNQSMLTIWNRQADQLEPTFSNNNFHPKSSSVENNVFNSLGRGNWQSCANKAFDSLEWVNRPKEMAAKIRVAHHSSELADGISGKSCWLFTGDKINQSIQLACGSATQLDDLADSSFDLVITDPPFGGLLHYSELSDYFYVWMRLILKDFHPKEFSAEYTPKALEAVSNRARNSDPDAFYRKILTDCWKESYRILKAGGILAFTFHHSEDAPWIDVLESLFQAGFYLEATYPIRSDEIKGEGSKPGTFGSQQIEYDIIHVCRKRLDDPTRISWARLRRQILDDVDQLKDLLEQHQTKGLPPADLRVIKRGKALEYYSRHYGNVFVEHGRDFSLKEALVGINQLLDDDGEKSIDALPVSAEAFSRQFLRIFRRTDQVPMDVMQKTLRGSGMAPSDFEKRGWCKKEKKVFYMVDPLEWAKAWKGQNRKGMARDLDQTLFLVGACFENSGINVWDTLNSSTFRHHPAIPDLLVWLTSNGASNPIKAAANRAHTIYLDWMERNKPEVEAAQAEFDFVEEGLL